MWKNMLEPDRPQVVTQQMWFRNDVFIMQYSEGNTTIHLTHS